MKATINGKRYDSDKCEELAYFNHFHNGNYAGSTKLMRSSNADLLVHCDPNGQDIFLKSSLTLFADSQLTIDDFNCMDDEQEEYLEDQGLLTIVPDIQ